MKKLTLISLAASAVFLLACPPKEQPQCTPQSCANGCCDASGACVTTGTAAACGLNGGSCTACGAGLSCTSGVCEPTATGGGTGGAMGGGTGGAMGGGTGGAMGGGTGGGATGGGTGGGATGGGTGGGGVLPDGGVDCATVALDPALGTLTLVNGATVTASAALPAGVVAVGKSGATFYGLGTDKQLKALGSFPTLSAGPSLGSVVTPADVAADAGVFLNGYLAVNGTRLLAGYTRAGAGFPGSVAELELADGGLQYVSAPGNYTAAGFGAGFLINGGSVGAASGAGVYVLDDQGPFAFATFDAAWQASNGFTAVAANDVLLLGYFDGTDFQNHVRAVPPSTYTAALGSRASFPLSLGSEVLAADDVLDLTTVGDDAVLLRGGFDFNPPYASYTTAVEKLPLTLAGTGAPPQMVTAGTPVKWVQAVDRCTEVKFIVGDGATLLLGVQDRAGRRLLRLAP